jgi:branched-subunit amino acid ABC-type transport system permease component
MDYYLQQLVIGLSLGMVYALVAIGFTLIFGVLNVVNFAHGEIYTIGAFAGLLIFVTFAPPLVVVLLIVLAVGLRETACSAAVRSNSVTRAPPRSGASSRVRTQSVPAMKL